MLTRPFLLLLVLNLFTVTVWAQVIKWSKTKPLQWSDFKGLPTQADTASAASVVGIRFMAVEYHSTIKKSRYKASAVFDCKLSYRGAGAHEKYTLMHERLHFDIAAIFAARLQKLADAKGLLSEREAKIFFNRINDEMTAYQHRYDNETANGADVAAQALWQKRVQSQLP